MLEVFIGVAIVAVLLFDIFQAVLVPRFTPASLRLAPFLVGRLSWPNYRNLSKFINNEVALDFYLGAFAPFAFVLIFVMWLVSMTIAFAFIIHGLGHEFRPVVADFGTALYAAGTAILTLGFGDIVAVSPAGRAVMLLGGATGITVVAIGVSFLFSMQQSVHAREVLVHTLQSRIAPHNSAVSLLLNYADLGITDKLDSQMHDWEVWLAQVLTSHRSFPLLCYFRSGHLCVPWITVIGVMLDTANLLSTTVNDKRFAHSEFFLQMGSKMVDFFRSYFELDPVRTCISRDEFRSAYGQLKNRGYVLHEEEIAWQRFHNTRSLYAPSLNALAFNFVCQTPGWLLEETSPARVETIAEEAASLA